MKALLSKLHYGILLWMCYMVFLDYETHKERIVSVESQIPVVKQRIEKKRKEKEELQNYFKDIEEAKKKIELVAQEVERIQRQLPSEISDTENLDLIKKIAEDLNIKNIFLTPLKEENKGFYYTKQYEFRGSGTYFQFLIFLEKVAENERLLNIPSLVMEKASSKQKGRFQLLNTKVIVEAYRFNPSYKEERGIEKIEQEFKNTTTTTKKGKRKS